MLLSYDTQYNPNLILQYGYDYDFLGQLISADYANATISDESYSYDSNGNRLTANGSTYTTSTNNELTSDSSYTYTYDDEGNRISKQNSTNRELYTWDYRNRLTSVTQQTYNAETGTWENVQIVEYTYDYNNVWIRKINGSDKTIFIPENYQTVVQIDNGTVSHYYLWTPNQQDKLLADVTADNVLWTLTDHLGSIRDVVGNSTTHLIYDAFGNLISGTNPILFGYTGKPIDTSTSLQNNINRWYDATVGRWLSTDPIGFEGNDTNLYRYVGNISISGLDMLGLESCGNVSYNPKTHCCVQKQVKVKFLLCIRCEKSHAWIHVQNLESGATTQYGKWAIGSREGVYASGVHTNIERDRQYSVERCTEICDFQPIYGFKYGVYGNNCSSYAQEVWQKYTKELLNTSSLLFGADTPTALCKSIRKANGGKSTNREPGAYTGYPVGGMCSSGSSKQVPDILGNSAGSSIPDSVTTSISPNYPLSPEESCGCSSSSSCGGSTASLSSSSNSSASSGWHW